MAWVVCPAVGAGLPPPVGPPAGGGVGDGAGGVDGGEDPAAETAGRARGDRADHQSIRGLGGHLLAAGDL